MIKQIFWNSSEERIRAFWRILIQAAVWFVLLFITQAIIGIIAGVVAMATGTITPEDLMDPTAVMALVQQVGVLLAVQITTLIITILTVWLAGRFLDKRPFADFGLKLNAAWWLDFAFGLFLGAVLMLLIFLVERAAGWVTVSGTFVTSNPARSFALIIAAQVVIYVCVGIQEELFSRGYQLTNLAEGFNNVKGIGPAGAIIIATLLSSMVFGALHIGNPNATLVSTINLIVAGVFLAAGYLLTGRLAIPIGLHITWNFFQGNVFGFPVSGTGHGATFIDVAQSGPDLWTGGAFGPEAGLIGIIAMLLGIGLTALWTYFREGEVRLHLPLAQPPERVQQALAETAPQAAPDAPPAI